MSKKPKKHHEEEEAGEAWLLPYSDLMTLLLAVFIVLFAVSSSEQKIKEFSAAFQGMNQGINVLPGGDNIFQDHTIVAPIDNGILIPSDMTLIEVQQFVAEQKENQMGEVEDALKTYFAENYVTDAISVQKTENIITVSYASDVLFPLGSAELTAEQKEAAKVFADIIFEAQSGGYPFVVKVSGYTDNIPIRTSQYQSNFNLSLDRAVNFLEAMVTGSELDPRSFSAVGCGDLDPVDTNDTAEGRQRNRRVEVQLSYREDNSTAKK